MKKILISVVLVVLALTMVTMTACSKDDSGFSLVSVDEEKANELVVATVDEQDITKGEVIEYIKIISILSGAPADYYFSDEMTDEIEGIKTDVLNILIEQVTIVNKAEEFGLSEFTDEDSDGFKSEVDRFTQSIETNIELQVIEEYTALGLETEGADFASEVQRRVDEWYDVFGGDKEQIVEFFKIEELYARVQEYVFKDIDVSEEEVKAFYDSSLVEQEEAMKDSPEMAAFYEQMDAVFVYEPNVTFNVYHILVAFDVADQAIVDEANAKLLAAGTNEEEAAAARAIFAPAYKTIEPKIAEIQAKIEQGDDFWELIIEYGEDPTMLTKPEGYAVIEGAQDFVPEFEAAAVAFTEPGQVSEPVGTNYGTHILKLISIEQAGAIPYEDVKDMIQVRLLGQEKSIAWEESFSLWADATDRVEYANKLKN